MNRLMTIEEVLDAARNEINNYLKRKKFKGIANASIGEINFNIVTTLYAKWTTNKNEAEKELWLMYKKEFPEFFN